jgi:hypothetical protein
MKHIQVDSYGRCNHNTGSRNGDKMELLKGYKFYLAFENSNEEDYVTEKVYQGLRVGCVPSMWQSQNIVLTSIACALLCVRVCACVRSTSNWIGLVLTTVYMGAPNINEFVPSPKSIIAASNYSYVCMHHSAGLLLLYARLKA